MKHGKKASKGHAKGSHEALKSPAASKSGKKVVAQAVLKAEKPPKAVKAPVEARPKGGVKAAPAVKGGVKAAPAAKGGVKATPAVKAGDKAAPAVKGGKASGAQGSGSADSRNKGPAVSGGLRPDVSAAFARALKKYPDALRRLAD